MEKMKAVVYDKKARPDKLVMRDVDKPLPGDQEVLIRIHACALNAADYRSMKMGIIPKRRIFGADIVGRIELAGKDIQRFRAGDFVMGDLSNCGFGGFAEYAVAPEKVLVNKPEGLTFEEAAALPLSAVTALQAMRDKGNIRAGQQVLIVGASGGVGTYAIQLAKNFGAAVTAVCSTRNAGQAISLGAERVIDYSKEDFTKSRHRFDLILAVNGDYPLSSYKRLLNPGGIYVMVGGSMRQILKSLILGRPMSVGSKKMRSVAAKANQRDLELIAKLAAEGKLRPGIDKIFPFDQAIDAVSYAGQGHARGKVVIKVR
jgi:2-desacetyl-2-hydroxyethyl bacteriochlorophyllide A dehydrogenase